MTEDIRKLSVLHYQPVSQLVTKETAVPRARFPAVDGHNHLGRVVAGGAVAVKRLVEAMDACNVQAVVDLDGGYRHPMDTHIAMLGKQFPQRFYVFHCLRWDGIDDPGYAQKAVAMLEESVRKGAVGLKVSKQLGLVVKTSDGRYVPVDTPKLDPVWQRCGQLGIPVLIHTGDPSAFFTPLDRHNERLRELADHPDWLFHGDEFFTKKELLLQRNRVIARHPGTTFIGAHVANLPEDLQQVRQWLDSYPNLYMDISARLSELGRQPYASRRLLIDYADRVIFGTDGNAMGQPLETMYRLHWRFLETDDEYFDVTESHKNQGDWRVYGLYLPDDVLENVYSRNILQLLRRHDR